MNSRIINENPKTLAVVFDSGDEVIAGLKQVALEYKLAASHFTAIGALREATLGFFDITEKNYHEIPVDGQLEVLSLIGDISLSDADPTIHAHVVLGRVDATTRGGHLMRGIVRPTLEVVVTESPAHLHRKFSPKYGLSLIDLKDAS